MSSGEKITSAELQNKLSKIEQHSIYGWALKAVILTLR